MTDKLRTLIKTLPEIEPKEPINKLVRQIIGRELRRLWEKRVSIAAATISVVSGSLLVAEIIKITEMLGTVGFWVMISQDKEWLFQDKAAVWQAFLEANPLREIGFLILLIAIFVLSLYIFLRKDD